MLQENCAEIMSGLYKRWRNAVSITVVNNITDFVGYEKNKKEL